MSANQRRGLGSHAGVTMATMKTASHRAPQKIQQGWSRGHRLRLSTGCRSGSFVTSGGKGWSHLASA